MCHQMEGRFRVYISRFTHCCMILIATTIIQRIGIAYDATIGNIQLQLATCLAAFVADVPNPQ